MNKKGGIITVMFWIGIAIGVWAMFAGKLLSDNAQNCLATQCATGIELWIILNFNLLIGVGLLLGIFVISMYFSQA
jgi:hypothetical protein